MKKMVTSILNYGLKNCLFILVLCAPIMTGMEREMDTDESDEQLIERLKEQLYNKQRLKSRRHEQKLIDLPTMAFALKKQQQNFCCTQQEFGSLIFHNKQTQENKPLYKYKLPTDLLDDFIVSVSPNLSKVIIKHWTNAVRLWIISLDTFETSYAKHYELNEQVPYHEASLIAIPDHGDQFAFVTRDNFLYLTKYFAGKRITLNMTIPEVYIPFESAVLDFNKQGTKIGIYGFDKDGKQETYIHPVPKDPNPSMVYY